MTPHDPQAPPPERPTLDQALQELEELRAQVAAAGSSTVNVTNVAARSSRPWTDEESSSDAWKVMIYRCDGCAHQELIWNARPHVTPFGGIACPNCSSQMTHVDWDQDYTEPDREPNDGDLVVIDLPPEIAIIYARRRIASGQGAGFELPPEHPDKEAYARYLAEDMLEEFGGHPPFVHRLSK